MSDENRFDHNDLPRRIESDITGRLKHFYQDARRFWIFIFSDLAQSLGPGTGRKGPGSGKEQGPRAREKGQEPRAHRQAWPVNQAHGLTSAFEETKSSYGGRDRGTGHPRAMGAVGLM